ncbi:polyphosphate kinase 2 [Bosea sp. (in: a-proteobacteria)]|uniref:polyphosphate kinase 2 n=1 Tax=Bosea sp. (in: a-proteobacteria) TaxID=1871050 RepID=UPI002732D5A5|nr:polyphosphate kinase 2 [Bosea sp. (in: a-proteobacteria)]MDP3407861.1 polyphosphate kinase 2 [Bosea sp. (in: a-proteobacteria)]
MAKTKPASKTKSASKSPSPRPAKAAIRLVPKPEAQEQDRGDAPGKAAKHKSDAARAALGPRGYAIKGFDIEAATLPDAITDAAFRSGDYPYGKRMKRKRYEAELAPLQIELQKLATWAREARERIVIVFEGRDGAGKGGTIGRFTQHLNPRQARVVALSKPSDAEAGQWYFQRYAAQMPTAGEITFFDRSWYNRAGVERVMGFCTPEQTETLLHEAPAFEGMLVRDGVRLIKLLITIGPEMQMLRLHARWHDPLKRWKLSPIDFEAIPRFAAYSEAFDTMLARSSTDWAPWHVIRGNDKLRARLNAIRHVLLAIPYHGRDEAAIGPLDDKVVLDAAHYLRKGGES